tara:strand:- start:413 stop:1303 length:891 start_codon:yes stop_codon:yes gene_type:complete
MEPNKYELEDSTDLDIEIVDDTPEEDRGRVPADPEKVKALEVDVDELDKYSKDAKDKMIQMKRVWNDERRRADAADRERTAAVEAAQVLFEENKRIKGILNSGEKEYVDAVKTTTSLQLEMAKKAYKDAYDMGDTDKLLEAQEEMTRVAMQMDKIKNFKLPPLQEENFQVQREQYQQPAQPDDKVMEWQERNSWFGQDEEMTASALGLHEKLKNGGVVVGSDEYYARLDETMRRRFPENFEEEAKEDVPRRNTVVAPATRSTAPKKVRLSPSQIAIAKKFNITPEQYARELLKLES